MNNAMSLRGGLLLFPTKSNPQFDEEIASGEEQVRPRNDII